MLDISNPLGFINQLIEQRKINKWVLLGIELLCSAVISFLFIAGGALTAHRTVFEAVGEGMLIAAVVMSKILRASELTRGMMFCLPAEEATKELDTNLQTLDRR